VPEAWRQAQGLPPEVVLWALQPSATKGRISHPDTHEHIDRP
jgi:hypothetical protein